MTSTPPCLEELHSFPIVCPGVRLNVYCVAAIDKPAGGFVTQSSTGAVHVWSADWTTVANAGSGFCASVAAGPSGDVIVGCGDGQVTVWRDSALLLTCKGHMDAVEVLVASPLDGSIVSGAHDTTAKVWDRLTGECVATLEGHTHGVEAMCVLDSGDVVVGSKDGTLRVWGHTSWTCTAVHRLPSGVAVLKAMPLGGFVAGGQSFPGYRGHVAAWRGDVQQWVTEIDSTTALHLAVVQQDIVFACTSRNCVVIMDGTTVANFDAFHMKPVALRGGRVALVAGGKCSVYRVFRPSRLSVISILAAAWEAHGGAPPPPADGDARVAAISHTLCLRRICRPRGETEVGRATELVEPFGQAVVAYL